jgi:uncharacterized phage-associated protein
MQAFSLVGTRFPTIDDDISESAMTHSALIIARYFLSIPDEDAGELVSNLKLQKLLYYAQGYYIATHGVGTPLFPEKIYAWKHGPVVKYVYNNYAKFENGSLPTGRAPNLPQETVRFLNEIYRVFGRFSAWALRDMTHKEPPWLKNYKPDVKDVEIPLQDLFDYFGPQIRKKKRA